VFFAPAVNADALRQIDDMQMAVIQDAQIPHDVINQCNGVLFFTLEEDNPKLLNMPTANGIVNTYNPEPEMKAQLQAYREKHAQTFKMRQFFVQASEKAFVAKGMHPEHANYQMGMSSLFYSQQYRAAYLDVMEKTGHLWNDASPFNAIYQAHMDICAEIYKTGPPREQTK